MACNALEFDIGFEEVVHVFVGNRDTAPTGDVRATVTGEKAATITAHMAELQHKGERQHRTEKNVLLASLSRGPPPPDCSDNDNAFSGAGSGAVTMAPGGVVMAGHSRVAEGVSWTGVTVMAPGEGFAIVERATAAA